MKELAIGDPYFSRHAEKSDIDSNSPSVPIVRKPMKIAILGWGSLLWDCRKEFDDYHEPWQFDGPTLPIEFTRVSAMRGGALTLVLDAENGAQCQIAYANSRRTCPDDAIADLRCREGTTLSNIGFWCSDREHQQGSSDGFFETIGVWAAQKAIDVVVWTALKSNFQKKTRKVFSIANAITYLQTCDAEGKAKAAEYIWRAPSFVVSPLRSRLQSEPWFRQR